MSTAEEKLATEVRASWNDFTISCLKKWMTTSSVGCPDFISYKWWNFCEWRNWFCFFAKAELAMFNYSLSKDATFFADTKEVLACCWHTDNFLIWKFWNNKKVKNFFWIIERSENMTFWAQNNHLIITARYTRCFLTVWERNRCDWWIRWIFDWFTIDEDEYNQLRTIKMNMALWLFDFSLSWLYLLNPPMYFCWYTW